MKFYIVPSQKYTDCNGPRNRETGDRNRGQKLNLSVKGQVRGRAARRKRQRCLRKSDGKTIKSAEPKSGIFPFSENLKL